MIPKVIFSIALLETILTGQVGINTNNPQLPQTLGSSGGLKVECILGCAGGGGGVGGDVNVLNFPATQPISGSVSVSNFPTTTSVSNFPTNQSVTVSNATIPVTGTFFQATQPVSGSVSVSNFPTTFNVGNFPATQPISGTVGISGTIPVSGTFWQSTQPVSLASTTISSGTVFSQEGTANRFSCFVQAATVTTQCQIAPAAGNRNYITGFSASNQAATVQTVDIVYGTGTNCATGITALTHKFQFGTVATTTSPFIVTSEFNTPLVPGLATAICVRPSAATAFGATITGYIAP